MNRLLASLIALVLLVSPVAKVVASCCPDMQTPELALPTATAEMPPCHGDMEMPTAVAAEPMHADCGHTAGCCDVVAALLIDVSVPLTSHTGYSRALQPVYAVQAKRPDNLRRPPSIG